MTCDICGDGFWSLKSLDRHMRLHIDENGYTCYACNIKVPSRLEFNMHQVNIHNRPQYSCEKTRKFTWIQLHSRTILLNVNVMELLHTA